MTKLEFIDKINGILIGLNTVESDALGSFYDELMRDVGWHPADEDEPEPYETVVVYCETSSGITSAKEACVNKNHCWSEPDVQWWCYPPRRTDYGQRIF